MAGQIHRWINGGDRDFNLATSFDSGIKPGERGTGTLSTAGTGPDSGDTVTLGSLTYTFETTPASAYDVQHDADDAVAMSNLAKAIMSNGVPGTNYFAGTQKNPFVRSAVYNSGTDDIDVTSLSIGTGGNITSTESTATVRMSWTAATLTGGIQNWATDDRLVFDGEGSQEPVVENADMYGLTVQKVVSHREYSGDLGTASLPFAIITGGNRDPIVFRGSGTVFYAPGAISGLGADVVVVDTASENVLTIQDGQANKLIVKGGKCVMSPTSLTSGSTGFCATVGPTAELTIQDGTGPLIVYAGDGIITNHRSRNALGGENLWIVVGPRGKLIQKRDPSLNSAGGVVNMGGQLVFDLPTDATFAGNNILLMAGTSDLSKPWDHTAGTRFITIGPNAKVNLGLMPFRTNVIADLRPSLPVVCVMAGVIHRWISTTGDFNSAASWDSGTKPGERGTGTITASSNPNDGDTVTLGSVTYQFLDTPLAEFDVQRDGSDATVTMANLAAAIMDSGTDGVEYFTSTRNAEVRSATDGASDDIDIVSRLIGTGGNITSTESTSGVRMSWTGATLTGGIQNWTTDDVAICDGVLSNTSITTNADMYGLAIQKFASYSEFKGDLGTSAVPLALIAGFNNDLVVFKSSGAIFFAPGSLTSVGVAAIVVDTTGPSLTTIQDGDALYLFVKNGPVTVKASTNFSASLGIIAAVGPGAEITLEAESSSGPLVIYAGDGLITSERSTGTTAVWVFIGPRGKLIQNSDLDLTGGALLNAGGEFIHKPPTSGVFGGAMYLMAGKNDLSSPWSFVTGLGIIIGPTAQVDLGLLPAETEVTVDLRPAIPVACI